MEFNKLNRLRIQNPAAMPTHRVVGKGAKKSERFLATFNSIRVEVFEYPEVQRTLGCSEMSEHFRHTENCATNNFLSTKIPTVLGEEF